jgi:hypothetical protein
MSGMYVAVQGNARTFRAGGPQVHGFLKGLEVGVSGPFAPITTRVVQPLQLLPVDLVLVNVLKAPPTVPVAIQGLDDLTFTYVPEPAGVLQGLLALGGLLLR